jgi:hypothetical protein
MIWPFFLSAKHYPLSYATPQCRNKCLDINHPGCIYDFLILRFSRRFDRCSRRLEIIDGILQPDISGRAWALLFLFHSCCVTCPCSYSGIACGSAFFSKVKAIVVDARTLNCFPLGRCQNRPACMLRLMVSPSSKDFASQHAFLTGFASLGGKWLVLHAIERTQIAALYHSKEVDSNIT